MDKPYYALNDYLLSEPREVQVPAHEIEFESYDPNDDESRIVKIEACRRPAYKTALFVLLSVIVIPLLLVKWLVKLRRVFLYSFTSLGEATHLIIHGTNDAYDIVELQSVNLGGGNSGKEGRTVKKFVYRFFPYYFEEGLNKFLPIRLNCRRPYADIHEDMSTGVKSEAEYQDLMQLHGPCQIDVPYKGVLGIFLEEVLSPFYIFQIASVTLWMFDTYYYYATAIIIMAAISVAAEIVETRRNLLNVRSMALYECPVKILRPHTGGSKFQDASSTAIVPGDIIEIPEGVKMPCDCVLLNGSAVVNEAMLTGESVPVLKTSLPATGDTYDPDEDKKYTIYAGTEVVQTRSSGESKVVALAVRTGFATAKGALVRSILYPKPSKFSFYSDSYKFIAVMFSMSFLGMGAQLFSGTELDTATLVKKCLDIITITVPPALPACMSIGISYALSRLKKEQIYCISPPRVNVAGKINVFCFDKTGTLTEEGLSIYGFRVASMASETEATFCAFQTSVKGMQPEEMYSNDEVYAQCKDTSRSLFVECLATCHSTTRVKGKLIGDPLDVEMFNSTGWVLEDSDTQEDMISTYVMPNDSQRHFNWAEFNNNGKKRPYQLGIVRRFDFSSKLQRMSAFVQNLKTGKFHLFAKGSPEKIAELSRPETVPRNFAEVLSIYTQKGCRVIALATRPLNINYRLCQKIRRDIVEQKLHFLGFLVMRNTLKEATAGVIAALHDANIRTVMATGDNAYTAVSVAQECGMLSTGCQVYLADVSESGEGPSLQRSIQWLPINKVEDPAERGLENQPQQPPPAEYISPRKPSDLRDSLSVRKLQIPQEESKGGVSIPMVDFREMHPAAAELERMVLPWEGRDEEYALAVTGKAFDLLLKNDPLVQRPATRAILDKAVVFARMSPDGKAVLVEALQNLKKLVGMCGDGANDCVALKAADVGISLSEAEASIAAPFTSRVPDITCVPKVLREGRAALATSFQCFKYMALYSMIQFTSVSVMYMLSKNLTDMQCLIVDLVMIVPLAITMSRTKSAKKLSKQLPASDLISIPVLSSILGQVFIQSAFQIGMYFYLKSKEWYVPPTYDSTIDPNDRESNMSQANTVMYLVSSMQYVATVVAFSIGKPFKKPMYTNFLFVVNVVTLVALDAYVMMTPDSFTRYLLDFDYDAYSALRENNFLVVLGLVAVVNSLATYLYEVFVTNFISRKIKSS